MLEGRKVVYLQEYQPHKIATAMLLASRGVSKFCKGELTVNDHTTRPSSIKLCECGCGQPAPIAKRTHARSGHIKGQPVRFIKGHSQRGQSSSSNRARRPIEQRFWAKVDKGAPDECWLWTGYTNNDGYGKIGVNGKAESAHRVAYLLSVGPIPAGMEVCHNCPNGDRPACCNPAHLWLGTHIDNMVDMAKKRRSWGTKLQENDVREIRKLYAEGHTLIELGRQFGVGFQNISRIVNRILWKHVT